MVRRTRNSVRNNTEMLDGDRTVEDWKKVPVVSLKLKCLANNIVSVGSKDELVQRLHAFHHPPPPPTAEDDEGEDVLNNPPDEIFMEEPPADNVGEQQQQREETPPPEERDDNNEEDTLPWQEREQGADEHREAVEEETEAPTNEEFDAAVQVAVDKVLHEQLQGMVEEVQEARSEREVARQEMVAMREEIARLQKTASQPPRARKSTTTTPATATRKASTATRNTAPSTANRGNSKQAGRGASNYFPNVVHDALSGNSNNCNDFHVASDDLFPHNPFALPAIDQKYLEAIERGEYVDFEKIKPKRVDEATRSLKEGIRLVIDEDDNDGDGQQLRLKKADTRIIQNFPEWLAVWNMFLAARLHYFPKEHAMLMEYQESITVFASQYKFGAVYLYDIDFRKKIANERDLTERKRTIWWGKEHQRLMVIHLWNKGLGADNSEIPCYNCGEKGHYANKCKKPKGFKRNQNQMAMAPARPQYFPRQQQQGPNFQNGGYGYGYQPRPVGPPPFRPSIPSQHFPPAHANPNAVQFCNKWNAQGDCHRGVSCRFRHACNRCHQQDHGGIHCYQQTGTPFRPQQI